MKLPFLSAGGTVPSGSSVAFTKPGVAGSRVGGVGRGRGGGACTAAGCAGAACWAARPRGCRHAHQDTKCCSCSSFALSTCTALTLTLDSVRVPGTGYRVRAGPVEPVRDHRPHARLASVRRCPTVCEVRPRRASRGPRVFSGVRAPGSGPVPTSSSVPASDLRPCSRLRPPSCPTSVPSRPPSFLRPPLLRPRRVNATHRVLVQGACEAGARAEPARTSPEGASDEITDGDRCRGADAGRRCRAGAGDALGCGLVQGVRRVAGKRRARV